MSATAAAVAVVAPQVVDGLALQTHAPGEIFTGREALGHAHASGARWIWLLADGGDPRPDALERLLLTHALGLQRPAAIVAGMLVTTTGGVEAEALPAWSIGCPDLADLVSRGVLPIRHTTFAHCLVDSECFTRHGLPDIARFGPYAAVEWSARVLRDEAGYFDPSSVVVADRAGGDQPGLQAVPALLRMLRSGAWSRRDRLAHIERLVRPDRVRNAA